MILRSYLIVIIVACCMSNLKGQVVGDTTVFRELTRLEAAYNLANHLRFNVTYIYWEGEQGASPAAGDTAIGTFKIHGDQYSFMIDSIETLQNAVYRITAYNLDSLIQVDRPNPIYRSLFRADLYDSLFLNYHIQQVHMIDSAGDRILRMFFKSGSPYTKYELKYDTATYLMKSVSIQVHNGQFLYPPGVAIPLYTNMIVKYASYVSSAFDDSIFASSRFFILQGGKYVPVSPYASFELINNIIED